MSKPILYSRGLSSCAWRVRTALAVKGVDYEYRMVPTDNFSCKELAAINPALKVPVFVHNGQAITESLAIIEYIDEVFPGPRLLPADPLVRARARAIALHIVSVVQPVQNVRTLDKIDQVKPGYRLEWAQYWLNLGLSELDKLVARTAGKYCVGDELTIADLCLPSIMYNARDKYPIDLSSFTTLLRIEKDLNALPAFQAATIENQPKYVTVE